VSACDRGRIVAAVEGRLDAAAAAAFAGHVAGCAACRRAHARLAAARAALTAAGAAPPPAVDFGRLEARLFTELDEPLRPARPWHVAARRPLALGLVAAAAAAALVVGLRLAGPPPAAVPATPPGGAGGPAAPTAAVRLRAVPILVQGEVRQVPGDAPVSPTRPLDAGEGAALGAGRLVLQLEAGTALVVAARSEVALRHLDGRRIDVHLGRGRVYAQVAPRHPGQEFVIHTAGHAVMVRGTRYSVERLPAATKVEVLEGVVEVHTVGTGWDRLGARVPAGTVMLFPDGANPARLTGTGMTEAERATFLAGAQAHLLAGFAPGTPRGAASGVLELAATPLPGEVAIDGQPVGATPLALRLPRGKRVVEITRSGYEREVRAIEIGTEPRRVALRLLETGADNERATQLGRHARVHQRELKSCYDQALRRHPDLEGIAHLRITLGADGKVTAATVRPGSGLPAGVARCLEQTVRRWRLGRGAPVTVDYPVVLKPELSFETP
jgi:hypothetical protein